MFVNTGVITNSSVQPGSTFTSKKSTSTAEATFSLSMVLYQTPISCDSSQFTLKVVAPSTTSTGSLSGTPDCLEDTSLPSVNISYSFPASLSFTSASSVSLVVTSLSGSPVFTNGVSYQLVLGIYGGGTFSQLTETITNNPTNQLTGDVTVSLSTVPTEYINEDLSTAGTGYTFSYFSSSAPALSTPSSSTLEVSFGLPVPEYFIRSNSSRTSLPCSLWLVLCPWLEVW